MGYRVEVIDKDLNRVGEIDEWISLNFTVRLRQEGIWQLLIKDGTPQSKLIQKGGGVVIWQEGVDTPILSGQVDTFQKYWTKLQHTGPGSVYIAGKCHNGFAYRRLAFPDPSKAVGQQYQARLASRPVNEASAGHAAFLELYSALGPGALPDREIPGLNLNDSTAGLSISDSMRFDVVGSKLEDWCEKRNVGYRFIYNPLTQKIDLRIFQPRDLSKAVRFSPELGNLREYIWTLNAPKLTRAIVGAAGEGLERYYVQQVDSESEAEWGLQAESFIDRRDIPLKTDKATGQPVKAEATMTDADVTAAKAAVEEAASDALKENEKRGNFQIYPIDTDFCKFGRDYFVGDLVTVAVDGTEYTDVVREVVISVDDGGNVQDVSPKIGQQGTGEPLNLYKTVSDMQRKLRRLEARM
ncbi:siphovirus ReqiPepy6 Gp37-like family protein [Streptomyces sp. NPDC057363]|uniref:siphovirus ReqiPepy6 Gp37-like family protein n=1 Tax=Streptomyces sp. NPDC057363 TaxID=3346107 RepID=UPI00363BB7A8